MMTVDDVIKLSKAGLSDDVIIQQIKKKGQRFDLSTDQLVQQSNSVSDRVIQVMIDPTKDPAPSSISTRTSGDANAKKTPELTQGKTVAEAASPYRTAVASLALGRLAVGYGQEASPIPPSSPKLLLSK
jgi:hypothetical protein